MKRSTTLWRGPSVFTGGPLALQATCTDRPSDNRGTGDKVQLAIWSPEHHPALKEHRAHNCGGCALIWGGCYVNGGRLEDAWRRIADDVMPLEAFARLRRVRHRALRLGMDGDPAAVPAAWWAEFFAKVRPRRGWTAFVHGWKARPMRGGGVAPACDPSLARWFMASADSPEERAEARALGYRTARVLAVPEGERPALEAGEVECFKMSSKGRLRCEDCMLCDGLGDGGRGRSPYWRKRLSADRPDIVLPAHGAAGQVAMIAKLQGCGE